MTDHDDRLAPFAAQLARIDAALAASADVERWDDFWERINAEYRSLCERIDNAGNGDGASPSPFPALSPDPREAALAIAKAKAAGREMLGGNT